MRRGNHGEHSPEMRSHTRACLEKELKVGCLVPVSAEFVKHLPGAEVCPAYIVEQLTMLEDGTIGIKRRPYHDLSYAALGKRKFSVNGRHNKDELPHIQYGHAFL